MIQGIVGKKVGMSQVFKNDELVPVTAIEAGPCTVLQVKTKERDGYEAVQVGFDTAKRANKPARGHFKNAGPFRFLRELPVTELGSVQVGQKLDASIFKPGELVSVTGTSKGKGYAGVVKRHHFRGGPKTHGASDRLRRGGSIGSTTTPGHVLKGMRMSGHMGNERVTVQDLEVIEADPERNVILLRGAVPGAVNGLVLIHKTGKMKSIPVAPKAEAKEKAPRAQAQPAPQPAQAQKK